MAEIGSTKIDRGQTFVCIGMFNHRRQDGSETVLAIWEGECSVCLAPFHFTAPSKATEFHPNRRCQTHKRPGCLAKPRKAN